MELPTEVLAAMVPVVAAVSGLVGHATARKKANAEARKSDAEAGEIAVRAAEHVVTILKTELADQETRCNERMERSIKDSEDRCEERLREAGRKRDEQYEVLRTRLRTVEDALADERVEREQDRQAFIASWEDGTPPPSKGVQ